MNIEIEEFIIRSYKINGYLREVSDSMIVLVEQKKFFELSELTKTVNGALLDFARASAIAGYIQAREENDE